MDTIHEYGVFCEYTVHYVLYYVDVCIVYSVDPSLAILPFQCTSYTHWLRLHEQTGSTGQPPCVNPTLMQ